MKKNHNIAVVGDGGWGTTLAIHLSKKNASVQLWGPFSEYLNEMGKTRENQKFLPGIPIPPAVILQPRLDEIIEHNDLIVFAVPSKYLRGVLQDIKKKDIDFSKKIILSVIKGMDTKKLLRISEVIKEELGRVKIAVLSGPNIASEVARGVPSTAVIASKDKMIAQTLQDLFNSETFRIYTNTDVAGTELGGSVKNIIAIACGICDGLGFGTNTKAALLTRGLCEIVGLGKALGAQEKTFFGLSGLGDLVTTCFNPSSRNRSVGEQLGQGRSIQDILSSMSMVAEGVDTVSAVYKLSQKLKVSMPITTEVYQIIYKGKNPSKVVSDLLSRRTKAE